MEKHEQMLLYHKPKGEASLPPARQRCPDLYQKLLVPSSGHWQALGQLDADASGLQLFTNDHNFIQGLTQSSSTIVSEYIVRTRDEISGHGKRRLLKTLSLSKGMIKVAEVENYVSDNHNKWFHCVMIESVMTECVMTEGVTMESHNTEISRLWESLCVAVSFIKRIRYGGMWIPPNVGVGQWIELSDQQVMELYLASGVGAARSDLLNCAIARAC